MTTISKRVRLSEAGLSNQLASTLTAMGLDPKSLEGKLIIPPTELPQIRTLVQEHCKACGVETESGLVETDFGLRKEALYIKEPIGEIDHTTPVLSRIAAGIKKHHNGARLAIDVTGQIMGRSEVVGSFSTLSNTVIIPWSVVIDPNCVTRSSTLGHELIHVKQQSEGRCGLQLKVIGSIRHYPELTAFNSVEIEAHLFSLRHSLRRLPEPARLGELSREEVKHELSCVASEASFVAQSLECLAGALPLVKAALRSGEPLMLLHSRSDAAQARWGLLIGRGTKTEQIVSFEIPTDRAHEVKDRFQAIISDCIDTLHKSFDAAMEMKEGTRKALVTSFLDQGLLHVTARAIRFLSGNPDFLSLPAELKKVRSMESDAGLLWRGGVSGATDSGCERMIQRAAVYTNTDEWLDTELRRSHPAWQAILPSLKLMQLSSESYTHVAQALIHRPDILKRFPDESHKVVQKLSEAECYDAALQLSLKLIKHLAKPDYHMYRDVALLLCLTGDTSGKAAHYAQKAIQLLGAESDAIQQRWHELFDATLALSHESAARRI